ncbi:MAG: hypothetical protein H7X79_05285 [Sporomusaceae bacterium]|nr:hypothetical protein [Sporomusaceae bacterium]
MDMTEDKTAETIKMCDSTLIEDIKLAVDIERLPREFTVSDIDEWMKKDHITKLDGTAYPKVSLELLTNYSKHTPITKKRKQKVLYTSLNGQVFSFNPF